MEIVALNFHDNMEMSEKSICNAMSDVSVAVENNIFYIERNIGQPAEMQAVMERIVAQNPRIRSCGISFIENYFPQKGRSFCPYAWRKDSLQVEGRPIQGSEASYLESDWFKEAVAADSAYWSEPFFDSRDNKTPLVAYMYPIHDQKGRVVAILGADLSLDFMTRLLKEQTTIFQKGVMAFYDTDMFNSYVLTNDGTYITHPDQRRILKGNFFVHIKDADKPGVAQNTISRMKERNKSFIETDEKVRVNRANSYMFYSPIGSTDWILVFSVETFAIDIIGIVLGFAMLFIITFVLLVTFFVCRLTIQRVAKPLRQLAASADEMADGQFSATLPSINSHDEIHLLRDSFANMQRSLSSYVEELKNTTAAKASIESELKIAHDIQMSMLPKTFPPYPERNDLDIFGSLTPAKGVGGDLFDFYIRDEQLFFCIGDVSGKGIPASLYMAVTRSLFRNISQHVSKPEQIINALNQAQSEGNDTNMFVTLFVGVLDLKTGKLCYCNAGHDSPLLLGSKVTILPCECNLPIGVITDFTFEQQEITLKRPTTIFLFTDGLNEAENIDHAQFGDERIMSIAESMVANGQLEPTQVIRHMTDAVHTFVGIAEQSDDLTMLAIELK